MDKDDERQVFDQVYRPHDQWKVAPCEVPDFICLRDDKPVLGVEVTELWQHETDARLSKVSGYFGSLLDGGEVIHKDDRVIAKVETIQIVPHDSLEPIAEVPAIMRKHPSPAERARLLGAVLEAKEKRSSDYLNRCDHVDLVIDDRSMLFLFSDFEQLIRPISGDSIRKRVTSSCFREIFLLTHPEKGGRVRVPLKASLLMEDLIVLEELLSEEAPELSDQLYSTPFSNHIAVSVLVTALEIVNGTSPATCTEEGQPGISLGCVTLHWTNQGKVIRDYTCMPEQVAFTKDQLLLSSDASSIVERIAARRSGYQAAVSLALPIQAP
ncbi:hypothetical protein ACI2IY_06210 [Lysobacter enzymogenes]|uniref:hypothetical protein n=1 Tax=Lysobacter enzymogenes TaxID=69 RepID=UPI00384AFDFD